ncbi:ribonuclease G [Brevundimonas subvibrioides]|uniref:Ribonuclease G n=1 Tax=Brevundimonas subvibrioides (strain ATCC 15264 / DSM 4735 / LMG 14903 / NBRC 16000 / CB 81) TaxID=633149 RepID=D9QI90_BRESC|nr:ribonuclease G [Brevundimonas subvibrioides]ADK99392.1 ribonuclease G [Brevundimonas subvibrioides ATCC 15264]
MKTRLLMAASAAALAAYAAQTDAAGGKPDPIKKSDPGPAPLTADQVDPAAPQPDPAPGAVGNAPDANPNPPVNKDEAAKASSTHKKTSIVWVQPGHETLGIGQLLTTSPHEAEALRAAGRARYASEAEIKAAKTDKVDVPHLDGI